MQGVGSRKPRRPSRARIGNSARCCRSQLQARTDELEADKAEQERAHAALRAQLDAALHDRDALCADMNRASTDRFSAQVRLQQRMHRICDLPQTWRVLLCIHLCKCQYIAAGCVMWSYCMLSGAV